jgi:hypothetical protein
MLVMTNKEVTKTVRPKPPNAGKGRPKGTPNKVTGEVKQMILEALAGAGGVEYLIAKAETHPGPFLALVGKVLPLQVQGDPDNPLLTGITVTFK